MSSEPGADLAQIEPLTREEYERLRKMFAMLSPWDDADPVVAALRRKVWAAQLAPTVTVAEIAAIVSRNAGVTVSPEAIKKALGRAGIDRT